jgi:HAD superfamily hydrolase (TIGR01484 family)
MLPIERLEPERARRLDALVFDLDDTLLEEGVLGERAYASLFRLRDAGLRLYACTGRPSGWAELLARQWPIDAAIAENGAVAWARRDGRVAAIDALSDAQRDVERAEVLAIGRAIVAALPELALADDNRARRCDVTIDVGEHRRAPREVVEEARRIARRAGLRTVVSSVHLHLARDGADKASGYAALAQAEGREPVRALARAAFVGDSGNDAAAFAAFGTTFGVANVRAHLASLTVPPRYVTRGRAADGFVELAECLVALREAERAR